MGCTTRSELVKKINVEQYNKVAEGSSRYYFIPVSFIGFKSDDNRDKKDQKVFYPLMGEKIKRPKSNREKIHILVVDDDEIIQDFFVTWLKRKGFEISVAKNGLEAIEFVQRKYFDLLFLDVRMPVMNGFEAFKRIKKINPYQKVIVMTGYSHEKLFLNTIELGAAGNITKPFSNLNEIGRMIESILQNEKI